MRFTIGGMKQLYPRNPKLKGKILYKINEACILEPDWLDEGDTFVKEYSYLMLYTDLRYPFSPHGTCNGVACWI